MMTLWVAVLLGMIGAGVLIQLLALTRQRRLFLRDPQRRRFFLDYVQRRTVAPSPSPQRSLIAVPPPSAPDSPAPPEALPAGAAGAAAAATAPVAASAVAEAVVYVDASGECTFGNQAARDLLHWSAGNLALRDVLAGGRGESDALMESLVRRGLVEQHPSILAGPSRAPLEISAVAVRDRDDNLWGAALFIRRPAAAPAALGNDRPVPSRH